MRVTGLVASRRRRKKVLKQARGLRHGRKLLRQAYGAVDRGLAMAYTGRKQKKRQYRQLWTIRLNAACRAAGLTYSRFIDGLKKANVAIDRKCLADLAATDAAAFGKLIEVAKATA
jgi:large subunit ribosomal protein L20